MAIVHYADLADEEVVALDQWYEERVYPVLTPLAVDPGHPFPYISDLALSLAINVADPDTGDRRFARLKVPNVFPRLVEVAVGRFLPVEELIAAKLDTLFVGMIVEEWTPFRVSRNADINVEEDEADDLLEAVETELRRRRFNKAVRLEVAQDVGPELARSARARARTHPRRRHVPSHAHRPELPVGADGHRPPGPEGRAMAGDHRRPPRLRR